MYLMSAAWGSLAIVLAALGATYGWFAWHAQGLRGLVRGAGLVLLPLGLWLTGTLRLLGFLTDWLVSWATGLVLSPSVILGTMFLVLAVVLLRAAARIAPRGGRVPAGPGAASPATRGRARPAVGDDDLADIEALLRRRGMS